MFFVRGGNRATWVKTSQSKVENQHTQPTYDVEHRIEARPHWWKATAFAAGQMTTRTRQFHRMTGKFKCWKYNYTDKWLLR